jgi:hypothetical protein
MVPKNFINKLKLPQMKRDEICAQMVENAPSANKPSKEDITDSGNLPAVV